MAGDHVLLFGHSHANCVAAALASQEYAAKDGVSFEMVAHGSTGLPGALVVTDVNGRDIINPILLKAIGSRRSTDPEGNIWLASMVAGNYAAELSMFSSGLRWNTWLPGEAQVASGAASLFVHFDAIAMTLNNKLGHFKRFLTALPMHQLAGFLHLEAPPAVRDPEFMIARMPQKSREAAASAGITELTADSISDAGYRRRVWVCQSQVIREAVEGARRYYLAPPAEAMDPEGFLLEKLRKDPSHANHEYGRLVLDQIASFVAQKRTCGGR